MVSFVYFDVGGVVIIDFSDDPKKWEAFERRLGVPEDKFDEFGTFWHEQEDEVNVGRELGSLVPVINSRFGCSLPAGYPLLAEFVDRFTPNTDIRPALDEIRDSYEVGLLTNMYPHMLDGIMQHGIMPRIRWDAIIDSSVDHVKKPDTGIFELAEQKSGFHGNEIAFVDNSQRNVDAAVAFGWEAFLYNPADTKKSSADMLEWLDRQK